MAPRRALRTLAALLLCAAVSTGVMGQRAGALRAIEGKVSQWAIPTPQMPRDPAVDAEGRIHFALAGADRIVRFDPASARFREWAVTPGSRPHAVTFGPNGHVFYAGNGDGTIGELDLATGVVRRHSVGGPSSLPYSLAIDARGRIWGALREGRVVRLDPATGAVDSYPMGGNPYGLAFDANGVLWVTRIDADTVTSIDPQTGRTRDLFLGTGSKPRRIALAPDGHLWISLYGAGKLAEVDPAAHALVRQFAAPAGPNSGPYTVLVDAAGRVWLAEYQADSIAILDPAKARFQSISLPEKGTGVRSAAFDAQGRYWYIGTASGKIGVIE
ncbi:MAG TPA: hypothetical protein VFP44_09720 [Usitatibacter sp.]|nr:hypothetical protein [Usitatibacter sp.]